MSSVLVLGCGPIGAAVAMDLSRDSGRSVTVADVSAKRLVQVAARYGVKTAHADLSQRDTVKALASRHDLVVGALASALGYQTLRAVIESGRNIVDISFMPEDPLSLDALARERGAAAIVDCGIGPGLSHMMAGFAVSQLTSCERVAIYIGGLPVERHPPYEYKAGFSPYDVVEEYVRPARVVENGHIVVKDALSEPELVEVPGVGTLEAFLTDGLRTLAQTIAASCMTEKTLRYPGHRELMLVLRESGFFSKDQITVAGQMVRPLDVTAALLFPAWTFDEGEADVTILRVIVEGRGENERVRYTWNLLDRYDPATGLRSMSRTTAFTAAAVVRLVEQRGYPAGVHGPEDVGQRGLLDVVLRDLEARGVRCEFERVANSRV
jgi:saccharopine dehydrogenase-like NADP-dependent oxidoreductase